ncbi:MAG TPA: molybdopterin-dependent oxidoreductase [Dehalococcoidia bacterium]|nr:molybdopterin-dependent oxidoreductase [Dehalococcoidia bacterium]
MCVMQCPVDVQVEGGKVTKVFPPEKSRLKSPLCPRAEMTLEWLHAPNRLTQPMLKTNGQHKGVSWDAAFDFITDKLKTTKKEYGANSLYVYAGDALAHLGVTTLARDFCLAHGSPNFEFSSSMCMGSHFIGSSLTFNDRQGWVASWRGPKAVLRWAENNAETYPVVYSAILLARERGAKIVVIDPKKTRAAKEADIHLQLKPGTDLALALGFLNVIITEDLYDHEFVDKWAFGFDKLVEHVKRYTPERVAEITHVPADQIREAARIYATAKPATVNAGISIDHCINGVQTNRALCIMTAIAGNFDVPGGNTTVTQSKVGCFGLGEDLVPSDEQIGAKEYPMAHKITRVIMPAGFVIDATINESPYPIKAMIFTGANPMMTWPNTNKVKRAFEKLDLLVVLDLFMTETAKQADVVLPVCTYLETSDFAVYYGFPMQLLTQQAIEPLGNSRPEWSIWTELAQRMGYKEQFPYKTRDEMFATLVAREDLFKPFSISLEAFYTHPEGVFYAAQEEKRYLKEGFKTPSGKVEIYSGTLEKYGYDPLPTYHQPIEPQVVKEYPFILTTGARNAIYTNSRYRDLKAFRKAGPSPYAEINSSTAEQMGIKDGDMVAVQTPIGRIELKARLTEDVLPYVIEILNGWPEANVNLIVDNKLDPISGLPSFRANPCRLVKI